MSRHSSFNSAFNTSTRKAPPVLLFPNLRSINHDDLPNI
jgi:hypothetical protein